MPDQNQTAPPQNRNIELAEGVHYVTRTSIINASLVEQAGLVITHRDPRGRYVLTVYQSGEPPREVTATYSEVPADGTFHLPLTRHPPLGLKSKRFIY